MAPKRSASSKAKDIDDDIPDGTSAPSREEKRKRKRTKLIVEYRLKGLSELSFKEQIVLIKSYLKDREYPKGCSQSFRRSLRRRTKTFRLDPEAEDRLQYGKLEHGLPKPKWLEVVGDPDEQKNLMMTNHISEDDGHHLGRDITHKRVTDRYYWQTVGQDCINFVRNCTVCQSSTAPRSKEGTSVGWSPAKSGRVQYGSGVWKQAGVAILGPFERTLRDNKFLVVVWDYFTKWSEAEAIPYTSSLLIARFLYSVMTRLGWVRITFYDEPSDFVQEIQDEFSSISRANQTFHAAEKPDDVSLDEPYCNSVMEALFTLTRGHVEDWDQHIDWAMYQYRTTKHPIMGYSPFQLMFNRAPYDPNNTDQNSETYEDHVQESGERKRVLLKDARRILSNARLRHHRRIRRGDEASNTTCPTQSQSQDSPPNQHPQAAQQLLPPRQPQQQQQHQQQQHQPPLRLPPPPPQPCILILTSNTNRSNSSSSSNLDPGNKVNHRSNPDNHHHISRNSRH
eukprot:XP_011681881.1 PREDICTED: gypsy retrotransposon integrase-like protein 1 [Strongylocentrotus purpuratus]